MVNDKNGVFNMNSCNNQSTLNFFNMLPKVTLTLITNKLPINAVKALRATSCQMLPITQPLIDAATQKKLEDLVLKKSELSLYLSISQKYPNYSEGRIQVLRSAICSLFEDEYKILNGPHDDTIHSQMIRSSASTRLMIKWFQCFRLDYKLAIQIVKIKECGSSVKCQYNYSSDEKKFIFCMDLLATNQLNPILLEIRIINSSTRNSMDEKILKVILKALDKNQSIKEVVFNVWNWCDDDLNDVLSVIRNNKSVKKIKISENNTKFKSFGWFGRSPQIDELEKVIHGQLGVLSSKYSHTENSWSWKRPKSCTIMFC